MKLKYLIIAALMTQSAYAATYECKVDKKYAADLSKIQSKEEIDYYKFKLTIKESPKFTIDRCSFANESTALTN